MASVQLNKLRKEYDGGVVAVKDVTVEIHDKEFIVLVGPSGCGKSTTLRMIAGLEDISGGTLLIDGKLMNDVPPKDRDIAMVFQNYALYPHMNVYDNMAFGLKLRKFSKEVIHERVHGAAKILDIEEYLDRKPKALSGGQRQRVAVGRAIVRKPKVFLFDEPLSNLDAKMRVQMRTEISKIHKRLDATMIYVTHDQTEAMTMGDRIVVMKDGNIMQIDSPLNLYNFPNNKFVASFIGSPAMNFIDGRIITDGSMKFVGRNSTISIEISKQMQKILIPHSEKELWMGIRPEHISVSISKKQNVTGSVEVVEPMGNEMFVYFNAGSSQIVSRFPPVEIKAGESRGFVFDLTYAQFFDKITEEVIR